MKRLQFLLFIFISLFASEIRAKEFVLFSNGHSGYSIVIPLHPTESEKYAATELQTWLGEISGVKIPIVTDGSGKRGRRILIGNCKAFNSLIYLDSKQLLSDSYICKSIRGDILINGGERGVVYGVYEFLKEEFGCRWYTKDFAKIPKIKRYIFSSLNIEKTPAFDFRQVFYYEARDYNWKVRNGVNVINAYLPTIPEEPEGGCYIFSGMHSFNRLVPVETYYEKHPEYFSEIKGKRISKQPQLCLSNGDVLKLCTDGILRQIAQYPECDTYSLSQNDWRNPCECKECKKLVVKYGTQSGILIWFVNQVADAVRKKYPDKYISTLAYQYTMLAPKNIKPRDNVIVYLCDIENCTLHDWDDCEENTAFYQALKDWAALTKNIYVNDYVSNFMEYLLPVPNFHLFQEKIRKCKELGCRGFRAYGANMSPNAEFSALKNYLLAQLLWDPDQDVDGIVNEFIDAYYGSSAKYVREYYELLQSRVGPRVHMHNHDSYKHEMYDDKFVWKMRRILEKASHAANTPDVMNRVEVLQLGHAYINCRKHPQEAKRDGSYSLIKRVIKRDKMTLLGERVYLGQFEKAMESKEISQAESKEEWGIITFLKKIIAYVF